MSHRKLLFSTTALISASAIHPMAFAADSAAVQVSDVPAAATQMMPQPTLQEELVYLRDVIGVQTLRLDQAEQSIDRQTRLIELQEARIAQLEAEVQATRESAAAANAALADISKANEASKFAYTATGMNGRYLVRSGDTLGKIARDYNTTVAALSRTNNISAPYRLRIGQQLNVPVTGEQIPALQAEARALAENIAASGNDQPAASKAEPKTSNVRVAQNDAPQRDDKNRDSQNNVATSERRRDDAPEETGLPQEVGQRPEEEEQTPYLALFSDVGGILTPRGTLYVEPSFTYTTSSDNRFFFNGTEILDAILIGAIEATDSDRLALTESIGVRYGLTSRLEIDGKFNYVYRDDRVSGIAIDGGTPNTTIASPDQVYGAGIGDVEMGAHYQINQGKKWPYVIANIRAKAPTGEGPFDVERTPNGVETQLATGSGYWTIEPSLTFILPTDPAVFFGNIGYQANLPTSPNVQIGDNIIQNFDAGDAIRSSFGIGLSLNERVSMNLGYNHSYIFQTKSTFRSVDRSDTTGEFIIRHTRQPAATVGAFSLGGSYLVNDRLRLNLNTAFGATDEAPDMTISLRAQFKLFE